MAMLQLGLDIDVFLPPDLMAGQYELMKNCKSGPFSTINPDANSVSIFSLATIFKFLLLLGIISTYLSNMISAVIFQYANSFYVRQVSAVSIKE